MAVTKDQVQFSITADASGLSISLDKLKKKTESLDDSTRHLNITYKKMSKTEEEYSKAISSSTDLVRKNISNIDTNSSSMRDLSQSYQSTNEAVDPLVNSINDLQRSIIELSRVQKTSIDLHVEEIAQLRQLNFAVDDNTKAIKGTIDLNVLLNESLLILGVTVGYVSGLWLKSFSTILLTRNLNNVLNSIFDIIDRFRVMGQIVHGTLKAVAEDIDTEIFYMLNGADSSLRKFITSIKYVTGTLKSVFIDLFDANRIRDAVGGIFERIYEAMVKSGPDYGMKIRKILDVKSFDATIGKSASELSTSFASYSSKADFSFSAIIDRLRENLRRFANFLDDEIFNIINGADSTFRKLFSTVSFLGTHLKLIIQDSFNLDRILPAVANGILLSTNILIGSLQNFAVSLVSIMRSMKPILSKMVSFFLEWWPHLNAAWSIYALFAGDPTWVLLEIFFGDFNKILIKWIATLLATVQFIGKVIVGPVSTAFTRAVNQALDYIEGSLAKNAIRWIPEFDPMIRPKFSERISRIFDLLLASAKEAYQNFIVSFNSIFAAKQLALPITLPEAVSTFENMKRIIPDVLGKIVSKIKEIMSAIPGIFSELGSKGFAAIKFLFENYVTYLHKFETFISGSFKMMAQVGLDGFRSIFNGLTSVLKPIFSEIAIAFSGANAETAITLGKAFDAIKTASITLAESFIKVGHALPHSAFILLTEYGTHLAPVITTLALEMIKADSIFVKFAGVTLVGVALALGGFSAIVVGLITYIGDLSNAVGTYLIDSMSELEKHSNKSEATMKQFEFTIKGFNRTLGQESVGSVIEWNNVIDDAVNNSVFSFEQLRKSVKLLVSEGSTIGISFSENQKLLKTAMNLSAQSGDDLSDVVVKIGKGIAGLETSGLQAIGVNLSQAAIAHSMFAIQLGKTVDQMTQQELLLARLNELYRQTDPILGAAKVQLNTIAGQTEKYNQLLEIFRDKLGGAGLATVLYQSALVMFAKALASIPAPILASIGTLIDFLGVLLKVSGTMLGLSFTIIGVVGAIKLLDVAIRTFTSVQWALNLLFVTFNKTLNSSIVNVTSLSAAMQNLKAISVASIGLVFKTMAEYLWLATKAMYAFTVSLLSNPLFIKSALIIGAISAVVVAIIELKDELAFLRTIEDGLSSSNDVLANTWKDVTKAFSSAVIIIIQSIKAIIIGLVGLGVIFLKIRMEIKKWSSDGLDPQLEADIQNADALIASLSNSLEDIGSKGMNSFDSLVGGSQAYGASLIENAHAAELLTIKQKALTETVKSIDLASIKVGVLGTDYEKLIQNVKDAERDIAAANKKFLSGTNDAKEALDEYKKAYEAKYTAQFNIDKKQIDSINEIKKLTEEVNKASLKNSKDESLSIIADFEEKRKKVKEYETALSNLGPVSIQSAQAIIAAYSAINKAQVLAIKTAKDESEKKKIEEANKVLRDEYEILSKVLDKNTELNKQITDANLTDIQKTYNDAKIESLAIDEQIKLANIQRYGSESAVVKALEKQKALLEQNAKVQAELKDKTFLDYWDDLTNSIQNALSISTVKEFTEFLAKEFKQISENPIVVKIRKEVTEAASSVGKAVSGVVTDVGAMGGGDVGKVASKAGEIIVAGAEVAMDAGKALVSGIAKAGGWIGQIVDIIMNADKYLKILMDMPKMILSVLEKLPGMMLEVAKTFPQMLTKIAEALPGILIQIVNAIPGLIDGLLSALPVLIERLAEAFPEIFVKLVSMIPKIVTMLIKALAKGIQALVKGLIRGIGNLISGKKIKIPDIKVDQKTLKQVARVAGDASKMFEVKDLAEQLKSPMKDLTDGVEQAFDIGTKKQLNAWQKTGAMLTHWSDEVEKIFTAIWKEILGLVMAIVGVIEDIFSTIAKAILDVFTAVIKAFSDVWEFVKDMFAAIIQAFEGVWEIAKLAFSSIVKAIGDVFNAAVIAIQDVFAAVIKAFSDLWEGVKQIFAYIVQAFSELWEVVKQLFATIVQAISDVFATVVKAIKDTFDTVVKAFSDLWEGLKTAVSTAFQFVSDLWDGLKTAVSDAFQFVSDIWTGLKTFVSDAFSPITDFFKGFKFPSFAWPEIKLPTITIPTMTLPEFDFSTLSSNMKDAGTALGNAVTSAIKKPFNVLIDVLNGLKFPGLSWNISAGKLGSWSGKLWDEIDLIPGDIARLAKGGLLEGFGTPVGTDTVPAMLSPGEFIMSRKGVDANGIGMLQQMNAGNKMQSSGPNTYNIEFNIQVDAKTTMDEAYIKNNLIPKMRENLKRASLDGEFVMSAKGVRS